MNPHTARDPLTQRILDLTLEIIFLLTGEDHMVVKIHEMVTDNSRHQLSNGHRQTQSFNTEPPPHSRIHEQNHEKILELSNKIIQLLTGEVPIRCEDVTIYLSMEEWEYLEEHKELYKDMLEKHQPIIAFDKSVSEQHTPVSYSHIGTENKTNNEEKYLNKNTKGRAESATYTERESLASVERHVPEKEIYPITEYSTTDIKEEPASCDEVNLTDGVIYKLSENAQTDYTSIYLGAEPDSHVGGDLLHSDIYPLTENTQSEDPSTDTKKESPTYEEGNFTDLNKPAKDTEIEWSPDNSGEYLKGKTNLMEINHSESFIESRKPDQIIYYTDLVTPKSVYKDHSALSTEMGKVSYSEPDLDVEDINYREEPLSFTSRGENSTSTAALTHQQLHIEGDTFSCPECGKYFIDCIALKTHRKNHTRKKKFKCTECGKYFAYASNLAAHAIIHTGEKPFKCNECGKGFTQAPHLAAHVVIHTGEKLFKCIECGRSFARAISLEAHRKIHTGEKPFKCSECGKCFIGASALSKHKRIHTGEKPFKCHECGKCFALASYLTGHKRIHTGEKTSKCSECGKCFALASYLTSHKRIHAREKTSKCTECGQYFAHPSTLAAHKMIHTGEKTFNCPECGKGFTQAASLSRHKKIHTGEKPFKCTVCGTCFAQASHLAAHTTIHTGEKPFKCSECGKCFALASYLTSHKRIHTGEKTSKCPECGKCFSRPSYLENHKRTHTT
uniref:C2H2-type domain-containing protein n=1 Tax=Leptobrachium leishanense TaxID=445787 RepID=A0A8C5MZ66_9ANUR